MIDLTLCPECGAPAEIQDRSVLESTDGPFEHVRIVCVRRHWFLMPVEGLARRRPEPLSPRGVSSRARREPGRAAAR